MSEAPALVVVDAQRGFADLDFWGRRNNPDAEDNIEALVRHWQAQGWPIVVVVHASGNPGSPLHPSKEGHQLLPFLDGVGDVLVTKSVNSSFHGEPNLDEWLSLRGLTQVVICGITTNHCCETTARVGGNLGYDVSFALDATHTFGRATPEGDNVSADELARVTATNLHGEFATVVKTASFV